MTVFFDHSGSQDGAWVIFFLCVVAAKMFGRNFVFRYINIPVITGYMIIGFLFGPYVLGAMNKTQTSELKYVTQAALSFIAMSAGAEIYIPEMKPLFRPILWISVAMIAFTMIVGTVFIYGVGGTPFLSWMEGGDSCSLGASLLVAVILSARSPTSVLAVVRELQAKGEITSIIIGITVAGDVFVLTIFAICMAMASNFCSGEAFDVPTFLVNIVMIPVAIAWGAVLGLLLIAMIKLPYLRYLILPLGFLMYLICDYILEYSQHHGHYHYDIDALLICITAGFVVGNSPQREEMVEYLNSLTTYVFIPFFTAVGLQLNLPVLIESLGFALTASIVRALCMAAGTFTGGSYVGLRRDKAAMLWLGLIPQAGVSLGLSSIVGNRYKDTWGESFYSTMLAVILFNQVIGPLGAKYLINWAGEAGKDEGDDDDPLKKTVAALNARYIDPHPQVDFETQTEEDYFLMAAKGEIFPTYRLRRAESIECAKSHDSASHPLDDGEGNIPPPPPSSDRSLVSNATGASTGSPSFFLTSRKALHRHGSLHVMVPREPTERKGYHQHRSEESKDGAGLFSSTKMRRAEQRRGDSALHDAEHGSGRSGDEAGYAAVRVSEDSLSARPLNCDVELVGSNVGTAAPTPTASTTTEAVDYGV